MASEAQRSPFAPLAPIVLVTGKGGVGKTTLAAGLATAAAKRDGSAVFIEFGDGETGKRVLPKRPKVVHKVVHKRDAVEQSVARLLNSKMLGRLFIGNFAVRRMLRAAPALPELAMLDAVQHIADEHRGKRVVVDMPATGHGLAWMRLPLQMKELFGSGGLYDLSERLTRRLVSPDQCSMVIVTLAERMVLQETLELCQALHDQVGMPAARLVVNRFPPAVSDEALAQAQSLAQGGALAAPAGHLLKVLRSRAQARSEAIATLRDGIPRQGGLRPLLLSSIARDPGAEEIADWLIREQAA